MTLYSKRIYLSPPHMGGSEMKYINMAYDENWIAPLGPNVDGFEDAISDYTGAKYCAALSSGTAAIHMGLILLGVKRGDEVIVSSFTFSATVNPIIYQGAIPVLVDSESDTWNLDPVLLEKAIKKRGQKRIKAIVVVHLYGMPAKMEEIMTIANRYGIPVIEDAAEALGSKYKGIPVGTFGKIGIFSFNGNKIITTSGGGAIISDDKSLIQRARFLASQARDSAPHYQHSQIGYNYRISNILAGIGIGQMEVIEKRVEKRREVNSWYRNLLSNVPGVTFHSEPSEGFYSNYWLTCIIIDPVKSVTNRKALWKTMDDANIDARPLWKPMHIQPIFKNSPSIMGGVSENLFNNGICMPSGSNLSDIELERISKVLIKAFKLG